MKTGAQLILDERFRQVNEEGWTSEHDDTHGNAELSLAACSYVEASLSLLKGVPIANIQVSSQSYDWPWEESWHPSGDPIRNLVKAGALIAAEIDRLQRLTPPQFLAH
jgi:hypothetical protein